MVSKSIITFGFLTILLLLFGVTSIWVKSASDNSDRLQHLVKIQKMTRYTSDMLHATEQRTLNLYRMTTLRDPFDQDDAYIQFRELGERYLLNREKILAGGISPYQRKVFTRIDKLASVLGSKNEHVSELIRQENPNAARELLNKNIMPSRNIMTQELRAVLDSLGESVEEALLDASKQHKTTYNLILTLGSVAFLLGLLSIYVIRRTAHTDLELFEQGNRVRALYEASSISGLSIGEQIEETLKLGCQLFGMEIGKVCRINEHNQTNTIINAISPDDYDLPEGQVIPLQKTFCRITYSEEKPVLIHNLEQSGYYYLQYQDFSKMKAYIAAPLWVNGRIWGTVSFSSLQQKKDAFTYQDEELIKLISNWASVSIERQIAQDMIIAKERAEAENLAKSTFLASMSHELRTPLNAIIGYNELMKDELESDGDKKYLSDTKKIYTASHHLLSLINDVLDLSKIESGKMQLNIEKFSLKLLITDLTNTIKPLIAENNNILEVVYQGDIDMVQTDLTKMQQILYNLLGNASKFTDNGKIIMTIRGNNSISGQTLAITIEDTGIGMTDAQIKEVFNVFTQATSTTSVKYGGNGLGLAISHRLCVLLGGEVSVTSKPDIGSIFHISIPILIDKPGIADNYNLLAS